MTGRSVSSDPQKGTKAPRKRQRRGRPGYDVESLLSASVEVFTKKGFDGASMEDLSRHLGISKSAIYHHVTSKDELLDLALRRGLDSLATVVAETDALDTGPVERLEHLLRASVEVLVTERPYVTLLLRVRGNTEIERQAMDRRRQFDTYLAAIVQEAAATGLVHPDIDPRLAARLLFGLVNSLTEWVRPGRDPQVVADTVVALALNGLLVGGVPSEGRPEDADSPATPAKEPRVPGDHLSIVAEPATG